VARRDWQRVFPGDHLCRDGCDRQAVPPILERRINRHAGQVAMLGFIAITSIAHAWTGDDPVGIAQLATRIEDICADLWAADGVDPQRPIAVRISF
jgi:hypothetical protein